MQVVPSAKLLLDKAIKPSAMTLTICWRTRIFLACLLGTLPEQKRHVLYDAGHDLPGPPVVKETLNWFDRYLGPVD